MQGHQIHIYIYLWFQEAGPLFATLDFGIEVGPFLLILDFFPGPIALLKRVKVLFFKYLSTFSRP